MMSFSDWDARLRCGFTNKEDIIQKAFQQIFLGDRNEGWSETTRTLRRDRCRGQGFRRTTPASSPARDPGGHPQSGGEISRQRGPRDSKPPGALHHAGRASPSRNSPTVPTDPCKSGTRKSPAGRSRCPEDFQTRFPAVLPASHEPTAIPRIPGGTIPGNRTAVPRRPQDPQRHAREFDANHWAPQGFPVPQASEQTVLPCSPPRRYSWGTCIQSSLSWRPPAASSRTWIT